MKKRWAFVMVLCVGLLCIYSIDRIYCQQEMARHTVALDRFTEQVEQAFEDKVEHNLDAVEDMGLFMQLWPNVPDKGVFEQLAVATLREFPDIMAVGYSDENHILRYWYPEDSGQSPVGANLSDTSKYPAFLTTTRKAEQEKRITVNKNPVQLSNGVAVFGARAPLYYGERFYGLVWGTFEADKVLQDAVNKIAMEPDSKDANYYIEVRTQDASVLYRFNQLVPQSPVREFVLPIADTHWVVTVGWSRLPQHNLYMHGLIWGIGSGTLLLLLIFLNGMFRRQAGLAQVVDERTKELRLKNQQLELEVLEHKDTEEALLESEQRLAALLAAVPDKLYRLSREGTVLDVRSKENDLYLSRNEIINRDMATVLPRDLYEKFEELVKTVVASGEMATLEYQLPINGSNRELEARLTVSANEEIVVIVRDITEKKQDEACEHILQQTAVRVLEEQSIGDILNYTCEQLCHVFEITLARVMLEDAGTTRISAAAGKLAIKAGKTALCCNAKGLLSGQAIETGTIQVVQCKEQLLHWQEKLIEELHADKADIQSEIALPLNLKGGTVGAFYLVSNKPNYWDERIVARLQSFAHQLSIAISAARDRQQLRLLMAGLVAAANAIVITDKDGKVEWINPAFSTLTGYAENEALGQNLMRLSGYQDEGFCQRFWQQLNSADEAWRGEFAQCRKDGSFYDEVMSITPVHSSQGDIINFIAIKEDITEQKMAAQAMAKANEVRAQAEKLSSLGTMAAGLSHEINQPLNSIKMIASGMVYAYQNGKERPVGDIMRNVEEISHQADRINNIIMHMRSFIRRDETQASYCQVNEAIEQSLKIVGSQLTAHGIKVNKQLADRLPYIYAIPTALEEIIVNLASNAMQAMDAAGCQDKQLFIRTWAAKNNVYIEVADTGPGIRDTQRTKVFEPFFSTKSGSDNLGLGLSIVQSIVTSCQGTISIVSGENEGAVFLITLPGRSKEAV